MYIFPRRQKSQHLLLLLLLLLSMEGQRILMNDNTHVALLNPSFIQNTTRVIGSDGPWDENRRWLSTETLSTRPANMATLSDKLTTAIHDTVRPHIIKESQHLLWQLKDAWILFVPYPINHESAGKQLANWLM